MDTIIKDDLIITGLVGLRPREDNVVEVDPLLPPDRRITSYNVCYTKLLRAQPSIRKDLRVINGTVSRKLLQRLQQMPFQVLTPPTPSMSAEMYTLSSFGGWARNNFV